MPMLEFFAVAAEEEGSAALADAALTDAGAASLGAESLGAAGLTDMAALGGEYGAGATGQGITTRGLAANTIGGGAGAGGAGINAAQVAAQQGAATGVPNSGIASAPYEATSADRAAMNSNMGYQGSEVPMPSAGITDAAGGSGIGSALQKGWAAFKDLPGPVQYLGGMAAINALGLNRPQARFNDQPYNGPLSKYHLSPNFKGITADPQDYQYKARYAAGGILDAAGGGPVEQMSDNAAVGANTHYPMSNMTTSAFATPYQAPVQQNVVAPSGGSAVDQNTGELKPQGTRLAAGGIASYKSGGNLSDTLNYYSDMMEGEAGRQIAEAHHPMSGGHDVGIYRDTDPDTMYLDPMTAAQVRMAKINKRANMQTPSMKRATPMGTINLKPQGAASQDQQYQEAAQGGIMHASSHLGHYAAGGQPRLLKGPGDGMSDDIPATIANKQPARLADGEFVVPADVVSHLGNGSTDAGAKKLHGMMDNVRKARTGRKAQGKQINPNRFLPK
jgi:hypothetical protein